MVIHDVRHKIVRNSLVFNHCDLHWNSFRCLSDPNFDSLQFKTSIWSKLNKKNGKGGLSKGAIRKFEIFKSNVTSMKHTKAAKANWFGSPPDYMVLLQEWWRIMNNENDIILKKTFWEHFQRIILYIFGLLSSKTDILASFHIRSSLPEGCS